MSFIHSSFHSSHLQTVDIIQLELELIMIAEVRVLDLSQESLLVISLATSKVVSDITLSGSSETTTTHLLTLQ